jgi:dTDP-4-dehydrorhamnose 3,5-epimerase
VITVETTALPGVLIITPKRFGDARGFFSETYTRQTFVNAGITTEFVQDNHSLSESVGTLRGLHFQSNPFAQAKLVRVVRGRIWDVAVDIRRSSATFGHHVAVELSAENWRQLLVPAGFAHGYVTLDPGAEVIYKVDNIYAPTHDHGVAFDDPQLKIQWPRPKSGFVLSSKDIQHPMLADLPAYFE